MLSFPMKTLVRASQASLAEEMDQTNALFFSESDMWMRCKAEALSCLAMSSQGSKLFMSLEDG
jgi:hypothetical protein